MKTRKLGRFGPEVSALGYGAMGLESVYGPGTDRQTGIAIHPRRKGTGMNQWAK